MPAWRTIRRAGAPQADGCRGLPLGQGIVGEIDKQLIGREIDVIKGDDVRDGLRENLRPPACFAAGRRSARVTKPSFSQMRSAARSSDASTVGVVIVIGPAQTQTVLSVFLGWAPRFCAA